MYKTESRQSSRTKPSQTFGCHEAVLCYKDVSVRCQKLASESASSGFAALKAMLSEVSAGFGNGASGLTANPAQEHEAAQRSSDAAARCAEMPADSRTPWQDHVRKTELYAVLV